MPHVLTASLSLSRAVGTGQSLTGRIRSSISPRLAISIGKKDDEGRLLGVC